MSENVTLEVWFTYYIDEQARFNLAMNNEVAKAWRAIKVTFNTSEILALRTVGAIQCNESGNLKITEDRSLKVSVTHRYIKEEVQEVSFCRRQKGYECGWGNVEGVSLSDLALNCIPKGCSEKVCYFKKFDHVLAENEVKAYFLEMCEYFHYLEFLAEKQSEEEEK